MAASSHVKQVSCYFLGILGTLWPISILIKQTSNHLKNPLKLRVFRLPFSGEVSLMRATV
jgi:hypothetical protein